LVVTALRALLPLKTFATAVEVSTAPLAETSATTRGM
jgi:hypothetical protein